TPEAITVPFETAVEKLNLPTTVKVTLNNESVLDVPVTWTTTNYVANQAGTVQLAGELDFSKTDYPDLSGTASIDVTVADKVAELTLTYP
ncbi:Ig-like domain-containing protein, partial [Streptomyces europaeiscabiei]|uniref:Ig-like domain-containing protein n=1 Tax=Streptomyces europaeiscabiei TaxID=146819 RepID=UPI0038F7097F